MTACSIKDVPSFERNHDAGSMAMLALEATLATQGESRPAWWLAGMSGDAFKFVYDTGAVFEPLRDRVPLDVLTLACQAAGWTGHWRLAARTGEITALVRASVQRGCPVITPFLGSRWYHGMVLIVGIDDTARQFVLRTAREDSRSCAGYQTVAMPEHWDGPVPGGVAWADTPLFVLAGRVSPPAPDALLGDALARAAQLHAGAPLPYADHPGAQRYSDAPLAGRAARQGEAALGALRQDLAEAELGDFALIWRIDAQLGQLHYDRANAAHFLRAVARANPARGAHFLRAVVGAHPARGPLLEAALCYEATARIAARVQAALWDKQLRQTPDLTGVRTGIDAGTSLVHALGHLPREDIAALGRDVAVLETPWGPAAIVDSPRRRQCILDLVDGIIANERRCVAMLQDAARNVGRGPPGRT
ncbi:MAG: hypothetical protein HYS20_13665 [Rhodocyclales bacterium]|nr:hypothetical protein [Rhodocyclales bacterium]